MGCKVLKMCCKVPSKWWLSWSVAIRSSNLPIVGVTDIGRRFSVRPEGLCGLGIGYTTECLRHAGRFPDLHISLRKLRRCSLLATFMLTEHVPRYSILAGGLLAFTCESATSISAIIKRYSGPSSLMMAFLGYLLRGVDGVISKDFGENVLAVSFSNCSSSKPVARAILSRFDEDFFLPFGARNVFQSLRLVVCLLKLSQCSSHLVLASSLSYLLLSLCFNLSFSRSW